MGAMEETSDSAPATYEELLRQTRLIYRELERYDGITRRQLQEEWEKVEAAIYVALDTTDDQSGRSGRLGRRPADPGAVDSERR